MIDLCVISSLFQHANTELLCINIAGKKNGLHGLYIRAFCDGLDQVLHPYRQDLLTLEQQLLADPHITAAHVQTALEKVRKSEKNIY